LAENIQRIFDFIVELDKLKSVLRKTKPVGLARYENSAEHSWQVCMFAQLLANESPIQVDVVRVIEILLVHDIPEIDAGDQIVYQSKNEEAVQKEQLAAERIFGLLPEPQATWCMSRWEEYEARQTNEAVFAYAVDRLMPVLQNLRNSGQSWKENSIPLEKILKVNAAIGTALPSVWSYVEVLIKEFFAEEIM
jgi:putative hydrolase of HD superfamily